jgi:hypothetical protein
MQTPPPAAIADPAKMNGSALLDDRLAGLYGRSDQREEVEQSSIHDRPNHSLSVRRGRVLHKR